MTTSLTIIRVCINGNSARLAGKYRYIEAHNIDNTSYEVANLRRKTYRNKSDLRPDSGAKPKKMKKRRLENEKEKFRKSKEWKEFRARMAVLFNHRDYITGKRLIKGFNVHHLKTEQDAENYQDISDESNFIPLNSYCHKMLHYLFLHYRKDKTVIDRLVEVLDKMMELSDMDDSECEVVTPEELALDDSSAEGDEDEYMDDSSSSDSDIAEQEEKLICHSIDPDV